MKGVVGMFERTTGPKLQRQDSAIKKAMRAALEKGRKNRPKMPQMPRRAQ